MIQNVRINSILTTFILFMIKDRNIGFWRIFSTSKTEKIPFYLKLDKFLCLGRKCQKRPKKCHFRCQIIFKYAKLLLNFQNNTILWTNKMDFQTFILTLQVWGTNYFSLFVSYRYSFNKTQLTEFPESKSDMPLFHWVLALK